tara:strand:+ start:1856 stop:2788 length:933 start_codon:yes stop_codon:yes gene_type:complete
MSKNLISIIIPTYNGDSTIKDLIEELVLVLKNLNTEFIVINDCSPDNTHEKMLEIQEKYLDKLTYIKLTKNFGEYNAVMAGLNNCNGEIAIIVDDDFQHLPSEVLKLAEESLISKKDVIFTKFNEKKHSILRNTMSKFANLTANLILNKPDHIYLSSFKSIKRKIINEIIKYEGHYAYIDGLIFSITGNVGTLQVNHNDRITGKSNYNLFKLGKHYANLLVNFSVLPLRFFFIFGFIISGISLVIMIFIFIEKLLNPTIPMGYASLILAIIFFSGIQILFLGFISEYIGKILRIVNKDRQYIIDFIKKKS